MNEQMSSDVKAILEFVSVIPAMQEDIKVLKEGQERIIDDVGAIKVGQRGFEDRLTKVESKLEHRGLKAA